MNRDLDGVYFRIERDGKWQNICFSDLTEEEMDYILERKSKIYIIELCKILGKTLRKIGDELDLVRCDDED